MSSCRDRSREMLPEYVHGNLEPGVMVEVAQHLGRCRECATEEAVLRELERDAVPEPDPWFYAGLPGKVISEVEARKRRKKRILVPVWAGSAAAAAAVAVMLIMYGSSPRLPVDMEGYSAMGPAGDSFLGLEEEILTASESVFDDLETPLLRDLGPVSEEFIAAADLVPGAGGYEMMDEMTMQIFEDLVEEMTRDRVGKRVTS